MKKLLVSASLALGLLASSTSALAATYEYSSSGKGFSNSWTKYDSRTNWVIEYGFNTKLINEDFTHTKHNTLHHTAIVKNNNGAYSDEDSGGSWAGIEVTHNGSTVYYYISF